MIIGIDASKTASKEKTGIDNTAYQIILNLKKIDRKNTYYLYTNKPLDKKLTDSANFTEKLIPFPRLWNKFRLPLALLKDKPDVFLALTNTVPSLAPENSTVLIHDLAFKFFPEAYSKTELFLQESAITQAVNKAKRIIFTSEANKSDFLRFYKYPRNQIEVAQLGYNEEVFNKSVKKEEAFENISSPYFLFVGRLETRKNVARLVEAFTQFKKKYHSDHKLVLAGKPGYGYAEIKKILESRVEYGNQIIMTGYVDDTKLAKLFRGAEAFVFPSLYEGFGLPILEAFACGTPVLTSNISTLQDVAGQSALLVDASKTDEITEGLRQISSDHSLQKKLINNGTETLKKYSWEKTAKKVLSILEGMK